MTTMPPINANVKLAGFYTVSRVNAVTGERVESIGPFKNDITDIGLEKIGTGLAVSRCYYGSGTTPASTSDTQMGTQLAVTGAVTASGSRTVSSPYWVQTSYMFRFDPAGVDRNITEVGVGWNDSSTSALWSRALIVDGGGSPVTLTLLAAEYLDVTYTIRYYPVLTDSTYDVTISGVVYSFVTRIMTVTSTTAINLTAAVGPASNITNLFGMQAPVTLGAVTDSPTYTSRVGLTSAVKQSYVAASKEITYISTSGLPDGNVTGGISGLTGDLSFGVFQSSFQTTISPLIPKDNTKTLTLSFKYSWDRY